MRLFISIPLEDEATRFIYDVQKSFRRQNVTGNYTEPGNLHITLAFIGEYNDPDAVLEAMQSIKFDPFCVTLDHVGSFGDLWWAGFEKDDDLKNLAAKIRRALAQADIPFDKKRFSAHITFLRRGKNTDNIIIPKLITPANMNVNGIKLMLSTRGKHSMIYTQLGQVSAQ